MLSAYTTKFDGDREEHAELLTPEAVDVLTAREHAWKGASEWAIRAEMDAAVTRSRSQSNLVRRAIARVRRQGAA